MKGGTFKLNFSPSGRQSVGARHVLKTPGREGDWCHLVSALYDEAARLFRLRLLLLAAERA